MVVYITEESVWAGPTLSHVAFACSYILCVKKKKLLDVEESLWAGPTRGQRRACGRDPPVDRGELVGGTHPCFFVRGACGRDPPGGGDFLKKD